jgi:hypothetical protein
MSSKLDRNKGTFSGPAQEHTLKEVVQAVKSVNITVQSNDVETHDKLDTTNWQPTPELMQGINQTGVASYGQPSSLSNNNNLFIINNLIIKARLIKL